MVRAMDSFNRADNNDLGSAWDQIPTEQASFVITALAAAPRYQNLDAGESNNTMAWNNNQWSEVRCAVVTSTAVATGLGVCLRVSTVDRTYYRCVVSTQGAEIAKMVAGVYTQLAVDGTAWGNNDVVGCSVIGTALQASRNGVNLFSTTDASIVSGRPGISHSAPSDAPVILRDWRGGDDTPDVDALTVAFVNDTDPNGN